MTNLSTTFWPGKVILGPGTAQGVGSEARELGMHHPFVMVDPGVRSVVDHLLDSLSQADLDHTLFTKIVSNPDVTSTDAAGEAYHAAQADGIIAIGGGSALDMAKGVRLLAALPPDSTVASYMSTHPERKAPPPVHKLPPMIAIPTTAGTGSEVTPWGVVTDHATQQKAGIGGVNLIPTLAIIDPELTRSLPPFLTAATGMDALSHLIEAYVSTNHNPLLDSLIERGVLLIGQALRRAVDEPQGLEARQAVMEAALLGGLAISSNWLGACHSLAHQLSTFANLHHGLACAIMLPPQIHFTAPAAAKRYRRIANLLAPERPLSAPEDAAIVVAELLSDIGLPQSLSAVGVEEHQLEPMADSAMVDLNWTTNPRPTTRADMLSMYQAVF